MMEKHGRTHIVLTLEELNDKFNIDNKAVSNIEREIIGIDISLIQIEIVMRSDTGNYL